MNKFKSSLLVKTIAVILFVCAAAAFAASAVGVMLLDRAGVYHTGREDMLKEAYKNACENYSVVALSDYKGDFNKELLEETNFQYGIIKTEDISNMDLTREENYLEYYFDQAPEPDELYVYSKDIYKDGSQMFEYGTNIFERYAIHNTNTGFREKGYPVSEYYYNMDNNKVYARSGKMIYEVFVDYVSTVDNMIHMLNKDCIQYNGTYQWTEDCQDIHTNEGAVVSMDQISIVANNGLSRYSTFQSDNYYVDNDTIFVSEEYEPETERYYVVSCARKQLRGPESFQKGDLFTQMYVLIRFMYTVRGTVIGILLVSLLVLAGSFAFLMAAAGHHRQYKEIQPVFLDRVPTDLYLAVVCLVQMGLAWFFMVRMDRITSGSNWYEIVERASFWLLIAGTGLISLLTGLAWCMSFAVSVKQGKWWRKTAVYLTGRFGLLSVRRCLRFCMRTAGSMVRSVSFLWKAYLALGIIAVLEYLAIVLFRYDTGAQSIFWLIEKAALYPLILHLLWQMNTLMKGAWRIAGGELDYRIDTDRMFWELKKHGRCLNDIGTGMNAAVNERLKSERFKTELITNVSHDIKTPLTSIINYVDLLQKEETDNPATVEYLDVLSRQSARLKKLIEDLMEASKASTGSLSLVMERCDAAVMLVQTVGEFEEKLMEDQIELHIKKPEESIYIEADSRHLWRVFDNLMNNICKYAQPGTRAYVNLERNPAQAVITFRNISRYQLNISSEELMERFVRGDSSRNTEGNGLGISIARSLTELMRGTFELVVDGDLFKVILSFPLCAVSCHGQEDTISGTYQGILDQELSAGGMTNEQTDRPDRAFMQPQTAGAHTGNRWEYAKPGSISGQGASMIPESGYKKENRSLYRTQMAAGLSGAGTWIKGTGQKAAAKTGRMFRQIGRFAKNVKLAAEQTKAEAKSEQEEKDWNSQEPCQVSEVEPEERQNQEADPV